MTSRRKTGAYPDISPSNACRLLQAKLSPIIASSWRVGLYYRGFIADALLWRVCAQV